MTVHPESSPATSRIYVANPLPDTLDHYTQNLLGMLTQEQFKLLPMTSIEDRSHNRAAVLLRIFWVAFLSVFRPRGRVLVTWPTIGLFEVLVWAVPSLRHRVFIIIHDPIPIRRQVGFGRLAGWCAGSVLRRFTRLTFITHTEMAASDLQRTYRIGSTVVPMPISRPVQRERPESRGETGRTIQVVGQFKPERDVAMMASLAQSEISAAYEFAVSGRGWPAIAGWRLESRFLSATEMNSTIDSAQAVLIPYRRFYQSDIAAISLEHGTPILGQRHEHLEELFGSDYEGFFETIPDLERALATLAHWGTTTEISLRHRRAYNEIAQRWRVWLSE